MTDSPTVAAFLSRLGETMPFAKAAGWDPVGLQIGDPVAPARRIAVCHEVTGAVVDAAAGIDLLVTYHPLLFRPSSRFVAGSGPSGRAFRLARAGTAVATVHTAFDVAPGGTGDALAAALDLHAVSGFGPAWAAESVKVVTFVPEAAVDAVATALGEAGAGHIGTYSACSFRTAGTGTFFAGAGSAPVAGAAGAMNREPEIRLEMTAPRAARDAVAAALVAAHPYEEPAYDVYERAGDAGMIGRIGALAEPVDLAAVAARVAARLGGVVRVAGDPDSRIGRVAVVPGSGGSLLEAAAAAGAGAVVTGDVKHHEARASLDRGVAVIDPGHIATERPGVAGLYAAVCEIAADAVDLTGIDPDPWEAA